jgi:glucuronoarabinoxylan endo-1,4-beta-xylanase
MKYLALLGQVPLFSVAQAALFRRSRSLAVSLAAVLALFLAGSGTSEAQAVTIDWSNVHQVIDGFGASDAQRGLGSPTPLTSAQQNFFFGTGTGQLGLNILRTGVSNGSDDPGSCASVGSSCAGNYVSDMQAAAANGARIYATSWSPPASMKTNGYANCTSGGGSGTLASGSRSAYATWLVNFVQSLAADGITVYAISPQNEPDMCETYDSSVMTSSAQDDFIKNYLGPAFNSNGITAKVFAPENSGNDAITGPDGGSSCMTDLACAAFVGGVNFHDYDSSYAAPDTVNSDPYPSGWATGKSYWETEAACLSGSLPVFPSWCPSGVNNTITDALSWAAIIDQRIVNDGANAWLWWWLISNENDDDQGLMQLNGTIAPRAYMLGQYAKFIRPGYYRIDATHSPQSGVSISAYQNKSSGKLVIVATNYTGSEVSQTFDIANGPTFSSVTPTQTSATNSLTPLVSVTVSGNSFIYSLPAQSITTFVGSSLAPSAPTNLSVTVVAK